MRTERFIGRTEELAELRRFLHKKSASLIVVQGRRRIGKSRLVEEFAKPFKFYSFSGLPPEKHTTALAQREEFAQQLEAQIGKNSDIRTDDWSRLFLLLATHAQTGRIIIFFDEISWMGSKDPLFLGKLKNAWDRYFKKNPELIVILCASASAWIEKNILSNTGFLGRISYTLTLEELPLIECNKFWEGTGKRVAAYEKLKVLSVTGGVPRYLEEIQANKAAEENIKNLCFKKGGLLVKEFERIFSDLFSTRSHRYKEIIKCIADGPLEYIEICKKLKVDTSGLISDYLFDLVKSGFITRDFSWNLRTSKISKISRFRLSDNYLRFYLKYIEENLWGIEKNDYMLKSITHLPGWAGIMGLQFENLVLNNRGFIHHYLDLNAEDIIADNPYFQRSTIRHSGCQIDYLIQTRFNTLFVCEIKFSRQPLGMEIIDEMQDKLNKLAIPRGFSCCPVLIHVNGVNDGVIDSHYFTDIIDFSEIFTIFSSK